MVRLSMFPVGTGRPTIGRREGKHLVTLKAYIRSKTLKQRHLLASATKFDLSINQLRDNPYLVEIYCGKGASVRLALVISALSKQGNRHDGENVDCNQYALPILNTISA